MAGRAAVSPPGGMESADCFLGVTRSLTGRRWLSRLADERAAMALAQRLQVPEIVGRVLSARGVGVDEADTFFNPALKTMLPDPGDLKGMDDGAGRLAAAVIAGERIAVFGDYDVDGIASSALLTHFLRAAGAARPAYFIPNRFEHGYGLTARTVDALLALRPHLVITVDNGITALEEIPRLRAAGIDTILTDHHLPRSQGVPEGIVINPLQPHCPYPYKKISGCGVTFKLVTALRKHLRGRDWWGAARPEPNLKEYLDLVAIATVADVVPLTGENRVLVHQGLAVLNGPRRRPGVEALLRAGGRTWGDGSVTARTLGFQVAPRINAAGRMTDGALAVELLLSEEPARIAALAQRLEQENDNRRAKGESMFKEAVAAIEGEGTAERAGIVVASPQFHEGVIGIVASRLVERYHRPVLVLADEPTGNLDAENAEHVVDLLIGQVRALGSAMVLATHNESIAAQADQIVRLAP